MLIRGNNRRALVDDRVVAVGGKEISAAEAAKWYSLSPVDFDCADKALPKADQTTDNTRRFVSAWNSK
jgi:hypothetical protein